MLGSVLDAVMFWCFCIGLGLVFVAQYGFPRDYKHKIKAKLWLGRVGWSLVVIGVVLIFVLLGLCGLTGCE